jgi:Rrf2 family protein
MLSMKAKYGLRAVLHLGAHYGRGPVLTAELAEQERIPKKFLEQILLELKRRGLLQSRMGKNGGYLLSKSPSDVTFGAVMRALDGPLAPVPCLNVASYERCSDCVDESCCGIRMCMQQVRDAMSAVLDKTSIADILERSAMAKQEAGAATYQI